MKRDVLVKNIANGGLNMPHLYSVILTSRIRWIKRYYFSEEGAWKRLWEYNMKKLCANPDLLLYCNFDINWFKNRADIDPFYKEIIWAWFLLQSNQPSKPIEIQYVHYNKELKMSKSPFYCKNLLSAGILKVQDLYDKHGKVLDFQQLRQRGVVNFVKWYSMISVIAKRNPIVNEKDYTETESLKFTYKGDHFAIENSSSKLIYCCIRDNIIGSNVVKPKCSVNIETTMDYSEIYMRPFNIFMDTYTQIFQYKFLNNLLVNNFWLKKWGLKESDQCNLCSNSIETQCHIFWDCCKVKPFWQELEGWFDSKNMNIKITKEVVFYGCNIVEDLVNVIIILAKRFIYRQGNKDLIICVSNYKDIEYEVAKSHDNVAGFIEKWRKLI